MSFFILVIIATIYISYVVQFHKQYCLHQLLKMPDIVSVNG